MVKKALSINFPIERVILSDVLPYEVPIVFSNRHLYAFLCKHSIKFNKNKITWSGGDESLASLIKLLLGIDQSKSVSHCISNGVNANSMEVDYKKESQSIPFVFAISHKKNQQRYLSLIHPKGQLQVVHFYNEFKDLIPYYCNRSEFSLRAPQRVAGCTYIDSKSNIEQTDNNDAIVELEGDDYENLRSFYVYKKFSNVFKFYESFEHLQSERKFQHLAKLDISTCFDGIYTHSIAWAIHGKEYTKFNIDKLNGAFCGKFDRLMQRINHNETNGIVIGPEVSRIFAEIILQSADIGIENKLLENNIKKDVDYVIYRYVDDYFIFYNNLGALEQIKSTIAEVLKEYKLSLNKSKEDTLSRPIITPISIAKKLISSLLNNAMAYEISEHTEGDSIYKKGTIKLHQSSLITDFKSILATSNVSYGDVLNYTLSITEKKVRDIIKKHQGIEPEHANDFQLKSAITSIIGFTFFIYSVSPKVNTTIKLCRIAQRVIEFVKSSSFGLKYKSSIYQTIFEHCCEIITRHSSEDEVPIETLYLLVLMRQLGRSYWLSQNTLGDYFNFSKESGKLKAIRSLNYFSITTILFYMSRKSRYFELRMAVIDYIKDLFEGNSYKLIGNSELTHLALDIISCPYVTNGLKFYILDIYKIPKDQHKRIINLNKFWFTKWENFNFSKELDAKIGQEVY